jgi:hypothetical protein
MRRASIAALAGVRRAVTAGASGSAFGADGGRDGPLSPRAATVSGFGRIGDLFHRCRPGEADGGPGGEEA